MPTKRKPRWGEFGFTAYPDPTPFTLSEQQSTLLANQLGITEFKQRQNLTKQLSSIADIYIYQREEEKVTPSRAERNAALTEVLKSIDNFNSKINRLDFLSTLTILNMLKNNPYSKQKIASGWVEYQRLGGRINHFTEALRLLLVELKSEVGRPEDVILKETIHELVDTYECFSRKKMTHTNHKNGEYTQEPQSQGGRFIYEFLHYLDENVMPGTITSAIAKKLKSRKRRTG